jgi:hypothetical protein
VWAEPREGPQPIGSLESEAIELAAAVGGGPVLTVPIGARVVWAWTSGDRLVDDATAVSHRMSGGVRAAIGTPQPGAGDEWLI